MDNTIRSLIESCQAIKRSPKKITQRRDGNAGLGSALCGTLARQASTHSFAFSAKTVPLEFLVDVKSLKPYHTVHLPEPH